MCACPRKIVSLQEKDSVNFPTSTRRTVPEKTPCVSDERQKFLLPRIRFTTFFAQRIVSFILFNQHQSCILANQPEETVQVIFFFH